MMLMANARQTAGKPVDYFTMETTRQQRLAEFGFNVLYGGMGMIVVFTL